MQTIYVVLILMWIISLNERLEIIWSPGHSFSVAFRYLRLLPVRFKNEVVRTIDPVVIKEPIRVHGEWTHRRITVHRQLLIQRGYNWLFFTLHFQVEKLSEAGEIYPANYNCDTDPNWGSNYEALAVLETANI